LSVLGEPTRPISEMTSNSYSPIQVLNGSYYGGGLFGFIYSYFNFDKLDVIPVGMGIGSSFTILIILLIILNMRWRKRFCQDLVNKNFLLLFVSSLIVQVYYTKIFSDISLHKLFYQIVPGLTTIRSPNRYLTILSFFIILTFFLIYDNYLKQLKSESDCLLIKSASKNLILGLCATKNPVVRVVKRINKYFIIIILKRAYFQ
jgi:hypothetical protein